MSLLVPAIAGDARVKDWRAVVGGLGEQWDVEVGAQVGVGGWELPVVVDWGGWRQTSESTSLDQRRRRLPGGIKMWLANCR